MAWIPNKHNTCWEIAVPGEGHDNASQEIYIEKRNMVLEFLQNTQSLSQHRRKFELLKKCYFYADIEPRQVYMTHGNHVICRNDIMQMLDPCQLQRIKEKGKSLIEIEMSLLANLLNQLEQEWEELSRYIATCDMKTFLSQWHMILKKVSQLRKSMATLNSLEVPGTVYMNNGLTLNAYHRGIRLPIFKISLRAKMPLIFDRNESFARKDWAKLKWFTGYEEPQLELYELHLNLLTSQSQTEMGYRRMQQVTSNTCIVEGLQPGKSYEFTVVRSETEASILVKWHDSIILTTTTDTLEDMAISACTAKG